MAKETTFEHPPKGHIGLLGYDETNDRWQAVYIDANGLIQLGTLTIDLPSGAATEDKQLPAGHGVTIDNASIPVTGTFWLATQPISAAALPLPTDAATSAKQLADGHNVTIDNASIPVTGTFWLATQPVSVSAYDPVPTLPVVAVIVDTTVITGNWITIKSYTVTEGKTLYLTDMWAGNTDQGAGNEFAYQITIGGTVLVKGVGAARPDVARQFNTPLKATSQQVVCLEILQWSGGTLVFCGGMLGFEV